MPTPVLLILQMLVIDMIGEENIKQVGDPVLTGCEGKTINIILNSMKNAFPHFKKASKQTNLHLPLNENNLTQIYVEQVDVQITPQNIGVKNHYSDIFLGTKGIPDFYFHKKEEGVVHFPLFIVEAKRLPAPDKRREKEYVVGDKNNGGIERYKTQKHGKNLNECGMLGFVEEETFHFWKQKINSWIIEFSSLPCSWQTDEILMEIENGKDFTILHSIAHRVSQNDIYLYHLWISLQ